MKNKLMSLKIDFAFKELMNNENVRNSFISAVLKISLNNIKSTQILNSYLRQEQKSDKLGILDVRLKLNDDTEIDIEMQVVPFKYWQDRTLFYSSKMYVESIEAGEKYETLKKVISISILNFDLLEEKEFYNSFHIRNDKTYTIYTDKMEWHIIELTKLPDNIETSDDLLLLWATFIEYSENEEVIKMLATKNKNIETAYQELQKISFDKEKREEYEQRQKALYDYNSLMSQARNEGLKQGFEQGIEKGIEKGIQKGMEQGVEKGIEKSKIEIAKNLLTLGLSIEQISQGTGLTIEQINKLKNNNYA